MNTNAEALELLRQIAADTRATREAVEAQANRGATPETAQAIAQALAGIEKASATSNATSNFLSLLAAR